MKNNFYLWGFNLIKAYILCSTTILSRGKIDDYFVLAQEAIVRQRIVEYYLLT